MKKGKDAMVILVHFSFKMERFSYFQPSGEDNLVGKNILYFFRGRKMGLVVSNYGMGGEDGLSKPLWQVVFALSLYWRRMSVC